jgi:hypothetical protein
MFLFLNISILLFFLVVFAKVAILLPAKTEKAVSYFEAADCKAERAYANCLICFIT